MHDCRTKVGAIWLGLRKVLVSLPRRVQPLLDHILAELGLVSVRNLPDILELLVTEGDVMAVPGCL